MCAGAPHGSASVGVVAPRGDSPTVQARDGKLACSRSDPSNVPRTLAEVERRLSVLLDL